jgi:hypothetical protein
MMENIMFTFSRISRTGLISLAALLAAAGCSSLKFQTPSFWPFADDKPGSPTQVVATWTDTVMYQPNQVPQRGFGGRLMFYEKDKKDPIKAEGTLTVYAFEENANDPNKSRPDRKYVFTKEQLAQHYSKSKIGHSYSVWLPWDAAGGQQKEVSLIVRFTPDQGSVIVSDQSKHLMPGETSPSSNLAGNRPPAPASLVPATVPAADPRTVAAATYPPGNPAIQNAAQWASYQMPVNAPAANLVAPGNLAQARQMKIATINLPPGLHVESRSSEKLQNGSAVPEYAPPPPRQMPPPRTIPSALPAMTVNNPAERTSGAPTAPWNLPSNHSGLLQSQVPGASSAPLNPERGPWQPSLGGLPCSPATSLAPIPATSNAGCYSSAP